MSGSAQTDFLRRGGPMAAILDAKYESGELERDPPYREYPKMLRLSRGVKHFDHATEVIVAGVKTVREWSEDREVFDEVVVASEAEEEAVLAGGKSEAQIEDERQALIIQGEQRGISVDPTWGLVRLQRELGAAPTSETIEVMRAKIADLEEKATLRARIAELEAQVYRADAQTTARAQAVNTYPIQTGEAFVNDEVANIRAELAALGVECDGRWGIARLRQELEAATAPRE